MILKFTVQSEWNNWKKSFSETFGNKGWSPIRYAFAFKYQAGSLLDYALKKERLLLEVRKSIDIETRIDLIAVGLPNSVSDKIDRETLNNTEDLYNEIGRLKHLVQNKTDKKVKQDFGRKINKTQDKTPRLICEKQNKGKCYHLESACWYKEGNGKFPTQKLENNIIQSIYNAELEVELNNDFQKN